MTRVLAASSPDGFASGLNETGNSGSSALGRGDSWFDDEE
jgi:hypothetical protein